MHSVGMPRRVDLPLTLAIAPFRTREVDAEVMSRGRLRSSDVEHPFHGVNSVDRPTSVWDRAEVFALLLRPGDAYSHTTAAALLGAPLPRLHDTRLHVTTIGEGDRFRRRGITGHRASALPVTMHHTLPIVDPAHLFTQLATMLGHDDLVAVGDYLVTPQRRSHTPAITSLDALGAAIPDRTRSAARARRALADVRVGAESRMESRLRLLLTRAGLPEPLINPAVRIGDAALHPDLLYSQWRVVLEYEGDGHRTDARQWRRDIWRREVFESGGWRVIRVHRDDLLTEPEAFLARVCRVLAQRQRESGPVR